MHVLSQAGVKSKQKLGEGEYIYLYIKEDWWPSTSQFGWVSPELFLFATSAVHSNAGLILLKWHKSVGQVLVLECLVICTYNMYYLCVWCECLFEIDKQLTSDYRERGDGGGLGNLKINI